MNAQHLKNIQSKFQVDRSKSKEVMNAWKTVAPSRISLPARPVCGALTWHAIVFIP